MMRAGQRCQVKLSRPHVEISPPPVAGILQMRISPWPWFRFLGASLGWAAAHVPAVRTLPEGMQGPYLEELR